MGASATAEGETQSDDAVSSSDPAVIVAGTTTQQPTQTALAIPAMPTAVVAPAAASAEANAATDGETPEMGAASPSVAPTTTSGQTAAGASTPPVAQAAAVAAPAVKHAPSAPPQADPEAAEAIDATVATTSSSANGQTPSKASASGVQTSPAQGAPATPVASASTAAGAQIDVAVDAGSSLQQKAGAVTEATATTTASTQQSSNATHANHPAQTAAPAATLQVYTRFVERFDGRAQRFEVRLDPAELGRVDVRIEVGADKKVHAVLAAHDSAALNDLMRGHRALERMLADAGIDLADGGVKFELAGDSSRNASSDKSNSSPSAPNVWRRFDAIDIPLEAAANATPQPWRRTRLDLVA